MPKLASEDSDVDVFEDTVAHADADAKIQLNGDLKDRVEEDEDADDLAASSEDDDEEQLTAQGKGDIEDDDEGDDGENSVFIVEAIRDHKFIKGTVEYEIKWQGYSDKENTWEPEINLLPHSREILTAYHKKIGGAPQAPIKRGKSKQSLRAAPSSDDLRASKRQKPNGADADTNAEEPVGTWLPKGEQWEDKVEKVETIERNDDDMLVAYIKFKNGKRTKLSMDMIYKHCPRPMLKFYEEHLKFK